jgi:integrase
LPVVLSPEEVARVIDSAENLMRRTMVMTLYSTGIHCSELCHLKVSDIDSERMVIRVHKGIRRKRQRLSSNDPIETAPAGITRLNPASSVGAVPIGT